MDQDAGLFIQAFWVKCREVIRPEIDTAVAVMRSSGHDPQVSTQEYAPEDGLPGPAGPALTLTLRPAHGPEGAGPSLVFRGDVAGGRIDVLASPGLTQSYEMPALGTVEVRAELEDWLARLVAP